jgi:hypothetical protein
VRVGLLYKIFARDGIKTAKSHKRVRRKVLITNVLSCLSTLGGFRTSPPKFFLVPEKEDGVEDN